MKEVTVPNPKNDSLLAQMESLYRIFSSINPRENLKFNLSAVDWACPLLILPISAYINNTQSAYDINKSPIKSYLKKINFPKGVDSISLFQRQVQKGKSYIPISVLKRKAGTSRERLEALFTEKLYKVLGNVPGAKNAVYYPIAELLTNIFEHSGEDDGFIFAQFYPNKKYLDVCIVDCGKGLAATYEEEKKLTLSDAEAISEAMKGNSVKSQKERGYGIRTSKRVICEGFKGGGFTLISGSAGLITEKGKERLVSFPDFNWKGVIIAYRIPKPTVPLDISPFLE